jgi:AdoMet-dependent heme synthase
LHRSRKNVSTVPKNISTCSAIVTTLHRPYVISWNLTYRCNLACEHCYLDAGSAKHRRDTSPAFADRSELSTDECHRVIDEIAAFAPESITILTGGEPLLRRDILSIITYAHQKALWTVVGSNGVLITDTVASAIKDAGVRGMALSLDALDPETHDRFRMVKGAWKNTVRGASVLQTVGLPFIVQTTVGRHNLGEIRQIADFAHETMQAKVFNLYFLVPSGRGQFSSDISPAEYNGVLVTLREIQEAYAGRMIVNAKCAPHYVRALYEADPHSPFLKTFSSNAGGCPAGTHYMGIRPNGDVTPCPYLPQFGGNLKRESLKNIWHESDLFTQVRTRTGLGGRCGSCEFAGKCGGCRARAYGMTGDLMAEDPLCDFVPGKFDAKNISFATGAEYGLDTTSSQTIDWDDDASARMKTIPLFVRGMVRRAVESHCRKQGIERVTVATLAAIRERMPTPKVFRS